MTETLVAAVAENARRIEQRIADACRRAGRAPESVRLLGVTKTQPRGAAEAAYRAGIRLFGENRIDEAAAKYESFHPDAQLHMIGHLQRNKARDAAALVVCVQSIDKVETAAALDARCRALGRTMEVLLEVNTSGEATKSGFSDLDALLFAIEPILGLHALSVRGLMTVGPLTEETAAVRRAFRLLREIRDGAQQRYPELRLEELSMGMSGDFEIAVEEGSTMVRIGTLLFGERAR